MSIYLYDEALVNKINLWTKSTDIHVYSPSDTKRLIEVIADSKDDKPLQLPIICVRRNGGFTINNPNRQPLSYDGATKDASYEKSLQINAIPVTIQYQLDVFTRYLQEADEYIRNIIFNIVNFPKITVKCPYRDANIEHDSAITLSNEVADNSDIPERLISGQFTRLTLTVQISDAYLWDIRVRDNYHMVTDYSDTTI